MPSREFTFNSERVSESDTTPYNRSVMSPSKGCRARGPRFGWFLSVFVAFAVATIDMTLYGQTEAPASPWTTGADLYSSYVWRGTRLGSGPHIQPAIEYSRGSFTAGAWASFDFYGYEEVDISFAVDIPGGFTIGMVDYYLPGLRYFDYSTADGSHAFEVNLGWESDNVWLSANYIINEAGGAGSYGNDLYFEAGLSFEYFSLLLGAGNGWHTGDGSFNACNLGLEVTEEIAVTDRFTIPVTGKLIFNPDREQLFLAVGFTF
jgi:hypothetical protein